MLWRLQLYDMTTSFQEMKITKEMATDGGSLWLYLYSLIRVIYLCLFSALALCCYKFILKTQT